VHERCGFTAGSVYCTRPVAATRTVGSLQPRPGRRRRQADSAQARWHLHFYGVTAEGVSAILARVNHEDRERVD
jgi:hypothetical protein